MLGTGRCTGMRKVEVRWREELETEPEMETGGKELETEPKMETGGKMKKEQNKEENRLGRTKSRKISICGSCSAP